MTDTVRTVLVDLLRDELDTHVDTEDPEMGDGWLHAHVALRAVEWVLDACGYGPDEPGRERLWRRLTADGTVDALARAHRQAETDWYSSDDDDEWPPPVDDYAALIEKVLDVDLAALTVESVGTAATRFAAPNEVQLIESIKVQCELVSLRWEPELWLVQRRVGREPDDADPGDVVDRFIAHWSYSRTYPNPWVEIGRKDAIKHMVAMQRGSLVWSNPPGSFPKVATAEYNADLFLYCFGDDARFFTNGHAYRNPKLSITGCYFMIDPGAMLDTGVVVLGKRAAGIWWHSEGDPNTPLGMSP